MYRLVFLFLFLVSFLACCKPANSSPVQQPEAAIPTATSADPAVAQPRRQLTPNSDLVVHVDINRGRHAISPLVYGVSAAPGGVLQTLRPTLNSWGGNPSTRYNWRIGHAWNAGSDWFFRNGNYGILHGSAGDDFISEALAAGVAVRLALPTLGWVAKDDNNATCSFPLPGGGCGDANQANCENPIQVADPRQANVPSDPASITAWMRHLFEEKDFDIRFVAMDNEPELWGYTHYDVHPGCTTYDEILEKYLIYTEAVQSVAPQAELTGPVTCCWYFYWNSAAGRLDKLKHWGRDFLPWFLDQVRQHDEKAGVQSLHVLEIHYYPADLYNENVDPETAAHRLRSTRSLWDRGYVDESWINEPVYLIPRMQELIANHYPGLRLGISEWNWGAEQDMNGALAIADVLGIYGREDVYFAAYWTYPAMGSPGFYAFRLYSNYDGRGSRFGGADGGISVQALSSDAGRMSSHAAIDQAGDRLYLMLINKDRESAVRTQIAIDGFTYQPQVELYQYGANHLEAILPGTATVQTEELRVILPAYSITLLVLDSSE